MNVCVLGSGGREHAIYQHLLQSSDISSLYCAPGNGGTDTPDIWHVSVDDFDAIYEKVIKYKIDVLLVGPEIPLAKGIKDYFIQKLPNLIVIGPNASQAQLEASKVFSFNIMEEECIPQAGGFVASSFKNACSIIESSKSPYVIKVDGLAAGKGVSIHDNLEEAILRLQQIFQNKIFKDAGEQVLIQEYMTGSEASVFAICDGSSAIYLPVAQDYKPVFDGNKGSNTGGMGSYCPSDKITPEQLQFVDQNIVQKILNKTNYRGILYVGLMLHSNKLNDLSVVEFNCRLGDPETQTVLPMLEENLFRYLLWTEQKENHNILDPTPIIKLQENDILCVPYKPGYCVNIVLAAKGYPSSYNKNQPLVVPKSLVDNVSIIHAGTKLKEKHEDVSTFITTGGRILNIISYHRDKKTCIEQAYSYLDDILSKNKNIDLHYRTDIGIF